jgi:c(7)-type cytochrome triheme protein
MGFDEREMMKKFKISDLTQTIILIFSLWCLLMTPILNAADSEFRQEFIYNYKTMSFSAQVTLIEKSEAIMLDEIISLSKDAMAKDVGFGQRMYLLDAASAMVSGYTHYIGTNRKLKKVKKRVDKLIANELKKEKAKNAELMKWKKEERFLGNFIMKANMKKMEKAGLPPVIYPHWVHRIWFECKVCHNDIFIMKRWRNEISQEKIVAGKQCGVCHNGDIAFSAEEKCEKCHMGGLKEAQRLHDVDHVDHKNISTVADKLGAEWNVDKLPDGKIPVDRFGFIDWLQMKRLKIFKPINSLDGKYEPKIRENQIYFKAKSKVKDVLFDHEVHSSWVKCSSCHPEVFAESLTNNVKMVNMSKGKFCGHCHGKVSFTFADCLRCHSQEKDTRKDEMLLHLGKKRAKRKKRRK